VSGTQHVLDAPSGASGAVGRNRCLHGRRSRRAVRIGAMATCGPAWRTTSAGLLDSAPGQVCGGLAWTDGPGQRMLS
jgi:hypothetical protein